uniref:Putative secreted protein n=1 Tax=Anopheles darlingi TaxID=43151 RepID=A0A2M4D772_ANODA
MKMPMLMAMMLMMMMMMLLMTMFRHWLPLASSCSTPTVSPRMRPSVVPMLVVRTKMMAVDQVAASIGSLMVI